MNRRQTESEICSQDLCRGAKEKNRRSAVKKVLFSVAAAMFALAAAAQNKAIDAIAEKYADADGFTVVNLDGDAIQSLSGFAPQGGEGTVTLDDGTKFTFSELVKDIVSVTAVVLKKADEEFAREAGKAMTAVRYSPIMSHNNDGDILKVSSIDIKRGKLKGNKEIVVMFVSDDVTLLARVIGKIDTKLLAKMTREIQKKMS